MSKPVKLFILVAGILLFVSACTTVTEPNPGNTSNTDTDIVVDPNCSALLFVDPEADCNLTCEYRCIASGDGCEKDDPTACKTVEQTTDQIADNINFSGIDFGPPERAIPSLIRMLLTAVMGLISVAAIIMGIYGMIVRTTAAESPEKIEESAKIFRNAIIGVVISSMGILMIQIIVLLLGITQGLFDFNFVPVDIEDLAAACGDGQIGYVKDASVGDVANYICRSEQWEPYTSGTNIPTPTP